MAISDAAADDRDLQQAIADRQPWFHNLHLPDGSQTAPEHPLGDFPLCKWREISPHVPENLEGWAVLDIGCNAGFYSFEMARRGARVTAIDLNAHYLEQARWAAGRFGFARQIEFRQMQIYDLADCAERYDLVLFLGVFYHLRYPLLGLDITARLARRLLLFQTLAMPGEEIYGNDDLDILDRQAMLHPGWPKMAFIEDRLAGDPTNWWAANHAGVMALLRSSGLRVIARPGHEIYLCEPDPDHPSCITTWNQDEFRSATGISRRS